VGGGAARSRARQGSLRWRSLRKAARGWPSTPTSPAPITTSSTACTPRSPAATSSSSPRRLVSRAAPDPRGGGARLHHVERLRGVVGEGDGVLAPGRWADSR
jgi:hypothetical protein